MPTKKVITNTVKSIFEGKTIPTRFCIRSCNVKTYNMRKEFLNRRQIIKSY